MIKYPEAKQWAAGLVVACAVSGAMAENVFLPDTQPKEWKTECTSCHVGFPPQLMRAVDWKSLMSQLDKHFGTDASVSAKENVAIVAWLTENGMPEDNKQRTSPDLRVTSTPFFQREHFGFIPEGFKHPAVKTAANCEACHANPEEGHYSHTTHIPEGIVQKPRPPRPAGAGGPPPGEGPPRPAS